MSNLIHLSQISWLKMLKKLQLEYTYFGGDKKVEEGEKKKKAMTESVGKTEVYFK